MIRFCTRYDGRFDWDVDVPEVRSRDTVKRSTSRAHSTIRRVDTLATSTSNGESK